MKTLGLALALLALAPAAFAADDKKAAVNDQYIDVSPVALPVVVGGLVKNYVFVNVRVDLTPSVNALKLREKEPYLRDAMVRAGHRTPFNSPTDLNHIDERRLIASLTPSAIVICGPGAVLDVKVLKQTPKTWVVPDKS